MLSRRGLPISEGDVYSNGRLNVKKNGNPRAGIIVDYPAIVWLRVLIKGSNKLQCDLVMDLTKAVLVTNSCSCFGSSGIAG